MNTTAESQHPRPDFVLFSPTAVAVLTFFFSASTGCLLLAYNSRQLRREAGGYIAGAVIGFPLLLVVFAFLPGFLSLAINLGLVFVLGILAKEQGNDALAAGYGVATKNALIGVGVGLVTLAVLVTPIFALLIALQG